MHFPLDIEQSWKRVLKEEFDKTYMMQLATFLEREWSTGQQVFPPKHLIFNTFWATPFDAVRVVIVGQDPYHGHGQAHGLSFSVPEGVPVPPSLRNIYKELKDDVGIIPPNHGCLISWAKQGVLLLNATLTVRQGEPLSHHKQGWERFTDAAILKLAEREKPVIFVLWGRNAQEKCQSILSQKRTVPHLVLKAAHPSPFSARNGFFGSRPFSKINDQLKKWGEESIDWTL